MAIANPAARFERSRSIDNVPAKKEQMVCVIPALDPMQVWRMANARCKRTNHAHYGRSRVDEAVRRGEMVYVTTSGEATRAFTGKARFTSAASGTWQKTQSGPVCTMQLRVGSKGRQVPAAQHEAA